MFTCTAQQQRRLRNHHHLHPSRHPRNRQRTRHTHRRNPPTNNLKPEHPTATQRKRPGTIRASPTDTCGGQIDHDPHRYNGTVEDLGIHHLHPSQHPRNRQRTHRTHRRTPPTNNLKPEYPTNTQRQRPGTHPGLSRRCLRWAIDHDPDHYNGTVEDLGIAERAETVTAGSEPRALADPDGGAMSVGHESLPGGLTGRDGSSGTDSVAGNGVSHREDAGTDLPESAVLSVDGAQAVPSLQQDRVRALADPDGGAMSVGHESSPGGLTGRDGSSVADSVAGLGVSHREDTGTDLPESAVLSVDGAQAVPSLQQDRVGAPLAPAQTVPSVANRWSHAPGKTGSEVVPYSWQPTSGTALPGSVRASRC